MRATPRNPARDNQADSTGVTLATLNEIRETGRSRGWDAANFAQAYERRLVHGDETPEGAAERAADEYPGRLTEQERWQFVDGYGEGWDRYIIEELED